ncbi:MAG: hypothetical protein ACM3YM_13765 [Sphingomonadales bacterium]
MTDPFNDFLERKRELSRQIAAKAKAGTGLKYRVRLRVLLGHKLNTDAEEIRLAFRGRRIRIRSRVKGKPLNDSPWIVVTATRFQTIEEATEFGHALQAAISVSAALRDVPIDVGTDNSPTGRFSEFVKERVEATGGFLIDDVHGLDVYPDTATAMVIGMEATASVTMAVQPLIFMADEIGRKIERLDDESKLACYLINAATISNHPVASATLCISAVELLSQSVKKSLPQRQWIKRMRSSLEEDATLSERDKADLLKAVNSMFHVGVSENVRRMMTTLGMDADHERWDSIYKARSELFHGARRFTQHEIVNLGAQSNELCRAIVGRYVANRIGSLTNLEARTAS